MAQTSTTSADLARLAAPDGVEVWMVDLDAPADPSVLDPGERHQANRLRLASERRRFVASRVAVRRLLARSLDADPGGLEFDRTCPRCGEPHGQPSLVGPATQTVRWSVSRSGSVGLVAITDAGLVGVDVERVRPLRAPMRQAERCLSPSEADEIRALAPDRRSIEVLQQWTAKEAVLKASGLGVIRGTSWFTTRELGRSWHVTPLDVGSTHVASIALRRAP